MIIRENSQIKRKDLQIYLEKNNIQTRVIFTGNILKQPGYKNIPRKLSSEGYKNADIIHKNGFLVSLYHGLNKRHIDYMYYTFDKFFKNIK